MYNYKTLKKIFIFFLRTFNFDLKFLKYNHIVNLINVQETCINEWTASRKRKHQPQCFENIFLSFSHAHTNSLKYLSLNTKLITMNLMVECSVSSLFL